MVKFLKNVIKNIKYIYEGTSAEALKFAYANDLVLLTNQITSKNSDTQATFFFFFYKWYFKMNTTKTGTILTSITTRKARHFKYKQQILYFLQKHTQSTLELCSTEHKKKYNPKTQNVQTQSLGN